MSRPWFLSSLCTRCAQTELESANWRFAIPPNTLLTRALLDLNSGFLLYVEV